MKRFNLLFILEAALLLGAVNLNANSIVLSVVPSSTTVNVNGTVSAAIQISGLEANAPNGPALGAFDFLFGYNPLFLGNPVVTFGDPGLGDQLALTVSPFTCIGTLCGAPSNFPIELAEVSLDSIAELNSAQASSFTLATISFKALAAGTSPLDLGGVILSDASGNALSLDKIMNSSVTVGTSLPTPEPRTDALLLAVGLGGLFLRRRWLSARA